MFQITNKTIDHGEMITKVSSPKAGAISTFIGVTRNYTAHLSVDYLFYEAYEKMSIKMMTRIGGWAKEKFDIEKIAMTHRIGRVNIEEASIIIAVSSGHRKAAIDACHYAIDTLKEKVPIWKKEFLKDGNQMWIANRPEKLKK